MTKEPSAPIVRLVEVNKSYRAGELTFHVLKNISLDIHEGEFVAIVGQSGSGKTTLLNIIGTLDTATSGDLYVDGEPIRGELSKSAVELRRGKVGFIFQFYNLFPNLTALENVEIGLEVLRLPRKEIKERAYDYLKLVNLGGKENKFPSQLSGGEQQRVAIARALAKHPRLILADEPTGNLDEATSDQIVELMLGINEKLNTTFILATHNPRVTGKCGRVIKIKDGLI